eukprot:GHVR01074964.1.p1 GENE.GHVR01074964.1~~GHVR01074964.1.p1  ORF type:complete len:155 (+),score=21.44 GHVR01074964.1:464-928(+)
MPELTKKYPPIANAAALTASVPAMVRSVRFMRNFSVWSIARQRRGFRCGHGKSATPASARKERRGRRSGSAHTDVIHYGRSPRRAPDRRGSAVSVRPSIDPPGQMHVAALGGDVDAVGGIPRPVHRVLDVSLDLDWIGMQLDPDLVGDALHPCQ